MQHIFGDHQCQSLLLYHADIVVFFSTVEQHLERLGVVLEQLQREGLKGKLSKCSFFRKEVHYLGHAILVRARLKWVPSGRFPLLPRNFVPFLASPVIVGGLWRGGGSPA